MEIVFSTRSSGASVVAGAACDMRVVGTALAEGMLLIGNVVRSMCGVLTGRASRCRVG